MLTRCDFMLSFDKGRCSMADRIKVKDLAEQLAATRDITLLDVRRKADFDQWPRKIKGARWFDPEAVAEWLDAVPRDRDVVVYCVKGGSVSQSVTEKLAGQGCRARFLEGGIKAWHEDGGAVS